MPQKRFSLIMKEKLNTAIGYVEQFPWLFAANPGKDFTRARKLPVGELLRAMLGMRGNSLNKELYDLFKDQNKRITVSAYVQQRSKLLPEACEYVFHAFNSMCRDTRKYKGYHLYAVDGTAVNIAKNDGTVTYVEEKNGQGGYNQFHANTLYDLLNRTYKDAVIQPTPQENEPDAALTMVRRSHLAENDILIADRGYMGYNFFETLNRFGVKYVCRIKDAGWTELRFLPHAEFDLNKAVELRTTQTNEDKKAYAAGSAKWVAGPSKFGKEKKRVQWNFESPFVFHYRCVRFEIAPGVWETLVTNLSKEEFSLDELKTLYHMRWGIETSYRELKYAVGLVNFHCRREDFSLQEIFARLTMYNFCERITMAIVLMKNKSAQRKYDYQVNYTMAIHIGFDFFRCHSSTDPPDVEAEIRRYVLPVRPGRQDKRKIKPKSFVYFLYRVA